MNTSETTSRLCNVGQDVLFQHDAKYHINKKGKVDHAPVWSVGGVVISLSVAVEPVGG